MQPKLIIKLLNSYKVRSKIHLKLQQSFRFAANEEQDAIGDIVDESFEVEAMNSSAKEFLKSAIDDYNGYFATNYDVDAKSFQNYYVILPNASKTKKWFIDCRWNVFNWFWCPNLKHVICR